VPSVLHVLPHRGGGGEKYIDLLESMPGYVHRRTWLSASRNAVAAGPSIASRWPRIVHDARRHDLIHLHGDMAAMIAVSWLRGRPGVVSTHGLSFLRRARGLPLRLANARWQRVALEARRIICGSFAERDDLMTIGDHDADRLTVIPNGVPLPRPGERVERQAIRAALGVADDDVVGLFIGLLDRYKDPLTAIRAGELARARGATFVLLLVGDGPLLDDVHAAAGPATRVLGFRDDADRLFRAADLFVMPSLREGSSFALLEAMGHGLAIVASDGRGIREMVGDSAIIASAGDVDAFAGAIIELASDRARRDELGAEARARVGDRFGVERFVAATHQVYEAVLTESRDADAAAAS
jgi:glycosyltransferase involved in cell wall biosynthesis